MTVFIFRFGLTYVATTLLIGGIGHALRFRHFRTLMRTHRIVPAGLVPLATVLVLGLELGTSGAAAARSIGLGSDGYDRLVFGVAAGAGSAFMLYVHRLVRHPRGATSCGCSPLSGPLTALSAVPATALLLVSLAGLAATNASASLSASLPRVELAIPVVWGATLAWLVVLVPASVPQPVGGERLDGDDVRAGLEG